MDRPDQALTHWLPSCVESLSCASVSPRVNGRLQHSLPRRAVTWIVYRVQSSGRSDYSSFKRSSLPGLDSYVTSPASVSLTTGREGQCLPRAALKPDMSKRFGLVNSGHA